MFLFVLFQAHDLYFVGNDKVGLAEKALKTFEPGLAAQSWYRASKS